MSKSWRELINSSIEWVALEFIRRDASGYHACSARHYCCILSRYERLLAEIRHLQIMLDEPLRPVCNRSCCSKRVVTIVQIDEELDYYAQMALRYG